MTNEEKEYLEYVSQLQDESEESSTLDTLKHIGKHVLTSSLSSLPGSYLVGGGKSVGHGLVGGALSGLVTAIATDEKNNSLVAPAGTGFFVGTTVGAKDLIDRTAKEKNKGLNMSSVDKFLSCYSKEGLINFSDKLNALIGDGFTEDYLIADNDIVDLTRGTFGAASGAAIAGIPSAIGGSLVGGTAGVLNNIRKNKGGIRKRIGSAIASAALGATSLGTGGAIIGGSLGAKSSTESRKHKKAKELLRRMKLNEYLTPEEKKFINNFIKEKERARALDLVKKSIENHNVGFSDSKNENFSIFRPIIKYGTLGLVGTAAADHAINTHRSIEQEKINLEKNKDGKSIPNIFTGDPSKEGEGRFGLSAIGGAGIGGLIGNINDSPITGAITGAGVGGLAHYLAENGSLGDNIDKGKALAIGLGSSALSSYIISKLMKSEKKKDKKKETEDLKPKKRGPGRPPKKEEHENGDLEIPESLLS